MNLIFYIHIFFVICQCQNVLCANNKKYPLYLEVKPNNNCNEQFYNILSDYANSPLVECINLYVFVYINKRLIIYFKFFQLIQIGQKIFTIVQIYLKKTLQIVQK